MNATCLPLTPDITFAPGVDDPAEHFAYVYRSYAAIIQGVVRREMRPEHSNQAEDVTAEAFTIYWRTVVLAGKPVHNAGGLIRRIAKLKAADFYRIKKNVFTSPYDLGDPVNTPMLADCGIGDLAGIPGMAPLAAELEAAMGVMVTASGHWKKANKATAALRNGLSGGTSDRPGWAEKMTAKLRDLEQTEAIALDEFRDACLRVAELRSEINAAKETAK